MCIDLTTNNHNVLRAHKNYRIGLSNNQFFFFVVDIFQSQDRSVCHGMNATVTCVTVISGGLLRWIINGQQVFSVTSGETTSFTQTVNGNVFVFVGGSQLSGVNIYTYTSTVSLNTGQAMSLSCSDGLLPRTFNISLIGKFLHYFLFKILHWFDIPLVEEQPSDLSTVNNKDDLDSVIMSWTPPADPGICCVQYRVMSSNGTTVNTTATSFTLSGITTQEERDSASISIRCMDQIGTMGPLVTYRPAIGMLTDSITQFDSLSLLQILNLLLFLTLTMLGLVVACLCMKLI